MLDHPIFYSCQRTPLFGPNLYDASTNLMTTEANELKGISSRRWVPPAAVWVSLLIMNISSACQAQNQSTLWIPSGISSFHSHFSSQLQGICRPWFHLELLYTNTPHKTSHHAFYFGWKNFPCYICCLRKISFELDLDFCLTPCEKTKIRDAENVFASLLQCWSVDIILCSLWPSADARLLEDSTSLIARNFAINNCHTGNLRSLVHCFMMRATELKASAQCEE